jgi:Prolyl oligopeptidase family
MHGTLDTMCRRTTPLRVVNELIKANKNFDLLLLPNRRHGYAGDTYVIRRRWDYFVRCLMGAKPPQRLRTQAAGKNNRGSLRVGRK